MNPEMNPELKPVTLRLLGPEDAAQFRTLRLRGLRERPPAFLITPEEEERRTVAEIAERLAPNPDAWVVGAFMEEQMVGCAGFYREAEQRIRHKGTVWGVYVAPEARGNGYGRRLLEFVIQRAGTMPGLEQMLLWVVPTNTAAHILYQSLGFVTFGIERNAMKTEDGYADEAFMALFLHSTIAP